MIYPNKGRLLVKVIPDVVKKGETKGDAAMRAEVIAKGSHTKCTLRDKVIFAPYGMDEIMVDGEKLIIINEELILATYEETKSDTKVKK